MRKIFLLLVFILAFIIAATIFYGEYAWRSGTRKLSEKLEVERLQIKPGAYDPRELAGLPVPVQRYFRSVLRDGQPMVAAVTVEHTGTFNMGKNGEQWKAFSSTQRIVTRRPGFIWNARIMMMPGFAVRVHDAYVAGEGILHATLFGLVSLVDLRGTPEMAKGELMRFLAEAAWYPTALLPSQGVNWQAMDNASAKASFKDGDTSLTMLFQFNEAGFIDTIRVDARGRNVGGDIVDTPWQGRFWNYEIRSGMRVPLDGEVAWLLPEGPKPYWRARIKNISYEFVQ
jgi:hypothetical protein